MHFVQYALLHRRWPTELMTRYNVIISKNCSYGNENKMSISLYSRANDNSFIWLQSILFGLQCVVGGNFTTIRSVVATHVLCFPKKDTLKSTNTYSNGQKFGPTFMLYDHSWDVLLNPKNVEYQECRPNNSVRTIASWCLPNRYGAWAFVFDHMKIFAAISIETLSLFFHTYTWMYENDLIGQRSIWRLRKKNELKRERERQKEGNEVDK